LGCHIHVNATTFLTPSQAKETGMRYVPLSLDQEKVTALNRYSELFRPSRECLFESYA
jgi:hypothetical protein